MKIMERVKPRAKEFGVELAAEFLHDDIIYELRSFCRGLTPRIVHKFILENVPPPIPDDRLAKASEYKAYFNRFTAERLFEWLNDARPDLARAIMETGDRGVVWWYTWVDVLKKRAGGETMGVAPPKAKFSQATCTSCGQGWVVHKEQVDSMRLCPFCGTPTGMVSSAGESEEDKDALGSSS